MRRWPQSVGGYEGWDKLLLQLRWYLADFTLQDTGDNIE